MTKTKSTKRALLMSALALLMCVSMLIGSTFAWFTDSVTSAGNKIQAGTLDIELWKVNSMMAETEQVKDEALFDYDLWEPGYTYATDLKLKNVGTLDAKFIMTIVPTEEVGELAEVIDVYYTINDFYAWKMATQWSNPSTLREAVKEEFVKLGTLKDVLNGTVKFPETAITAKSEAFIQIAMVMQESAGNTYQGKSAGVFDLRILATQLTSEKDSFDDQYDKFADYDGEISNATSLAAAFKNGGTYKVVNDITLDSTATVAEGVSVTLDLNGYTISADMTKDATTANTGMLVNKGTLTICGDDASKLVNNATNGGSLIYNTGKLTLDGGNYVGAPRAEGGYPNYIVRNNLGGNVTLKGNVSVSSSWGAFSNYNKSTLNIENATIYHNTDISGTTYYLVCAGSGSTINIYDGDFTFNKPDADAMGAPILGVWDEGSKINVYGGNFDAAQGALNYSNAAIEIFGGTFKNAAKNVFAGKTIEVFVADGYVAIQNADGSYTVIKGVAVSDAAGLTEAIASGKENIVLTEAGTYTLPTAIAGKTVTITGTKDTKISVLNTNQNAAGATITFNGVTIQCDAQSAAYTNGIAHAEKVVYNDCVINGTLGLFSESEFNSCTFNIEGNYYNVCTWGANKVTFTGCTFNCDGKALLVYGSGSPDGNTIVGHQIVNVASCKFYDNDESAVEDKAAIEITSTYKGGTYDVNITNTIENGFDVTVPGDRDFNAAYGSVEGASLGTALWGNKCQLSDEVLNVVIDGKDAY